MTSSWSLFTQLQKWNVMYMRILFLAFDFMAVQVKCGTEVIYLHIMIIILSDKHRLS